MRPDPPARLWSRRQWLCAAAAVPLAPRPAASRVLLVWLAGGMSHLDTFDMKPGAPAGIRSPFREIPTSVPGIRICEHLPRIARRMHKLTLVRSMTGADHHHQRAAQALAGACGAACPELAWPWWAWDHHQGIAAALRDPLLPRFDLEFSDLLDRLETSGELSSTVVVATGEFGRSPTLNRQGGRDHHGRAWTAILAGGGLAGGRVIGATDGWGMEPVEDPVTPEDLGATLAVLLGQPLPSQGRPVGKILRS
jgi:hypothetical protein